MCTIALPTIKHELGFDEGSLQWVMTAYALTVRSDWRLPISMAGLPADSSAMK